VFCSARLLTELCRLYLQEQVAALQQELQQVQQQLEEEKKVRLA
jgi:AmiR/NasT family two-component response regulator